MRDKEKTMAKKVHPKRKIPEALKQQTAAIRAARKAAGISNDERRFQERVVNKDRRAIHARIVNREVND
jgi:hypothetical protein